MPDDTGRGPDGAPPTTSYERSPVDVLRLVVGAVVLVVVLVLEVLFGDRINEGVADLFDGLDSLPTWLIDVIIVTSRLLTVVLLVAGVVAAAVTRRWRVVLTTLVAVAAAAVLGGIADVLVGSGDTAIAPPTVDLGPLTGGGFPTVAGLAAIAAAGTTAEPWITRPWRRLVWALIVAASLARFVTAPTSLESIVALLVGWVVGSAALVVMGGPVRRPTDDAVAEALGAVGVPVAAIRKASVDARGSTPYFATTADGESLFVKALGVDERSADLLFRAYRRLMPRDLGDERSFSTLRRTVEHEALVALAARHMGVRTPEFRAFAHVEPDAFVLAYQGIDGSSLDGVDPAKFDDALLAAVWEQVGVLRRHRVAHRDLRLANVFRGADGEIWLIDFGFSELAASDLLLATDLAELLASTSLVVGPDRALEAGIAAVGAAELTSASARLHPFALSGATRTGMKETPGLLDRLRLDTATLGGA
jgi:undecaprenyl-diphosphatase